MYAFLASWHFSIPANYGLTKPGLEIKFACEEAEKVGRDPASISLAYNSTWYTGPSGAVDIEGERRLFTGGTDAVKEDLAALAEIGVETFMFRFAGKTLSETEDAMSAFAESYISG